MAGKEPDKPTTVVYSIEHRHGELIRASIDNDSIHSSSLIHVDWEARPLHRAYGLYRCMQDRGADPDIHHSVRYGKLINGSLRPLPSSHETCSEYHRRSTLKTCGLMTPECQPPQP